MRLPRDLSAGRLVRGLERFGYSVTRRKGSHIRLTTQRNGEHHVTVPDHDPLKVGTLGGILADVAQHLGMERDAVLKEILG